MERNFNVDRRFRLFADKLTSNHASKDLIIESSYNTIELSSNAVIFDGIVDLSIVTCNNINISNISEIVTKFLRVNTLTLPSNVVISYNSVNDGYIINTSVGYNLQGIGRSDAYFTYINVSGGDSSFNDSLYINKNLLVDGTLTINNDLLINGTKFEIIENSFNNYKASLEQNFYSTKITTKDLSALNITISNELVVNKTAFINDLTLSGQLLNNVLRVPNIFTIDPSGFDNHSGTLIINGDFTVLGAITTLSSSNIDICDVAITLASKLANRLDLINANAGLDISNIASLKYNGTSWDFSGGQLTVDNKKILFADDISLAKRNFDLSLNTLKTDFSSTFFILKRNIDNSFNDTYNRTQIDSSFILKSAFDVSLIYLNTYVDNSYVSKNQSDISFRAITTRMDMSYVAKNSVLTGQPQYDYSTSTISQFGQDIFGEETNTYSGYNVSLSEDGTIIGITAPYNNGTGTLQGSARIYKYNDVSWVQLGQDIDGEANNDVQAIIKLSKDGTIAALGSWFNSGIGSIRVFKYNDISWIQQGQDIDGTAADDEFGRSISLSANGKIIAIGATHNDTSYYSAGQVLVYSYNDVSWNIIGTFNGFYEEAYTGFSVSLSSSGTTLAISTLPSETSPFFPRVDVYELSNNAWSPKGPIIYGPYASNDSGSRYGRIIELSSDGTIVAINDRFMQNTNYGRVLVYKYTSSDNSWNRLGSDISGPVVTSNEDLDPYIALSADGTIIALGYVSDSDFKGLVRLYKFINNNWIQIGTTDLSGDNVEDRFGFSIALSSNGSILAIGSVFNPPNNIGRVRTYNVNYAYTVTYLNSTIIPNSFDISFASFNTKVDLSYVLKTVFEASHNSLKNRFEISFNTIKTSNFEASSIIIDTINTRHSSQMFTNTLWNQLGLDISNGPPLINNNKKIAVSNDGKVVALSSSSHSDISKGRIYVYELSYNQTSYIWRQLGLSSEILVGLSNDDQFGWDIALSSDGRVVAGSSIVSDASGINCGQVRLFELSNNNLWRQKGFNINGPRAASESGYSISLAGNGNRIASGAWKDSSNGTNAGSVRVYDFSANVNDWRQQGQTITGVSGSFEGYATALSLDGQTLASASILPISISGGTISISGEYIIHSFTTTGTSTFRPAFNGSVEVLIVGGGGGGGGTGNNGSSGGGGAGGVVYIPSVNVSADTSYSIFVGDGGSSGANGQNSTAFTAIAAGGGRGGLPFPTNGSGSGNNGGSGGGAGGGNITNIGGISSGNSLGSNTGFIYGCSGGSMTSNLTDANRAAGGGGAGTKGFDTDTNSTADGGQFGSSSGGDGIMYNILGPSYYWGGGGGGAGRFSIGGWGGRGGGGGGGGAQGSNTGGPGGGTALNSGGGGGTATYGGPGGVGGANTGGGGGGGSYNNAGGKGGSGIVVIRYLTASIPKAQVKTFTISGTTWNNKGTINGYDISFGRAIKLSANGNAIVIGAPGYLNNFITNIGQAYVYGYQGGTTWTQLGQAIQGISGGDEFGSSVSISNDGKIIAIGSDNNSSNRGQVRVFGYANNYWTQLSNAIDGKTLSSKAGIHALSGDGTTLIQSNNTYNSVYGINKDLVFVAPSTAINTTISGDLAIIGRTYLKSFKISNKHIFDVSINGYSSNYLASTDISASIIDYYSNVGSTYNKVFKIDACGNVTNYSGVYGAISDSRLKENIVASSPKLEDLLKVRVVNYNLKNYDTTKYIGVLAQELEELFPELVLEDDTVERLKSVNYSSLTIMLIKALQEQQVLINNLIATLEELEN